MTTEKLVLRSDIVNYMKVGTDDTYREMDYFDEINKSKEVQEYSRKYVNEKGERTDAIGMSETIDFSFDRHTNNEVQKRIIEIFDKELLGDDANVILCTVDFTQEGSTTDSYKARARQYTVIPESEGDGTEAYKHTGAFKSKGDTIEGEVTSTDNWKTCTFISKDNTGGGVEG